MTDLASSHLAREVPVGRAEESAAAMREHLACAIFASLEAVYVVDEAGMFRGTVPLTRLMPAPATARLAELVDSRSPFVRPENDEERVATVAFEAGLGDVPVVASDGRFLGVVPAPRLIGILRHEHIEDLRRMAGIAAHDRRSRQALEESPWRRLRDRMPWLMVGLAGSIVATMLMQRFEAVLASTVAVAFFVPAIVYLADAIGTQTEAAAVRFLSFGRPHLTALLGGEIVTGFLLGSALGATMFIAVLLLHHDLWLAVSVSLALVFAGTIATTMAILLPWVFWRLGKDPAYGSGPLCTIIQDVLSLLVYFLVVTTLIGAGATAG